MQKAVEKVTGFKVITMIRRESEQNIRGIAQAPKWTWTIRFNIGGGIQALTEVNVNGPHDWAFTSLFKQVRRDLIEIKNKHDSNN